MATPEQSCSNGLDEISVMEKFQFFEAVDRKAYSGYKVLQTRFVVTGDKSGSVAGHGVHHLCYVRVLCAGDSDEHGTSCGCDCCAPPGLPDDL